MGKKLILLFLLLVLGGSASAQSFLDDYKTYRTKEIHSVKSAKSRKLFKKVLSERVAQLDSVFSNHKVKTGYDFNNADTINIIIQTSIESNYSSVIVWNSQDTISYMEDVKVEAIGKEKKITLYAPFLATNQHGISISPDRDSLVVLVSIGDFEKALQMAEEYPVFDGASSNIIKAERRNGRYFIRSKYLPPFFFYPK